jgi:hypothetical protein
LTHRSRLLGKPSTFPQHLRTPSPATITPTCFRIFVMKPSNVQNHFYFQRKHGQCEESTTISTTGFKTTAMQKIKLNISPQISLLITLTRCHIKTVHPHVAIGSHQLSFQRILSLVRNPDDTCSTAQQSLGLQVHLHKTGKASYFDGNPPFQQFYHLHKH